MFNSEDNNLNTHWDTKVKMIYDSADFGPLITVQSNGLALRTHHLNQMRGFFKIIQNEPDDDNHL